MFNSQQYSYRKRDRLIFQVIDAVETWLNRSILQNNVNDTTPAPPLSFVPVFVSKWIDYSNKYGFGYQVLLFRRIKIHHYDPNLNDLNFSCLIGLSVSCSTTQPELVVLLMEGSTNLLTQRENW
jgi:hypothetical protein